MLLYTMELDNVLQEGVVAEQEELLDVSSCLL
jgi:hypothetical protein